MEGMSEEEEGGERMPTPRGKVLFASSASETAKISVLVLSDVCLYREGLVRILAGEPCVASVLTAHSGADAVEVLSRDATKVALIDLALAGALETVRMLRARFPEVRFVALGVQDEQQQVVDCAEAGMIGYVCRTGSAADLVESIRCAGAGELACSRQIAGVLIARVAWLAGTSRRSEPASPLTPREVQIVRLVDEGLTNKEIASRLNISAATARNHIHSILEKLGVRTRSRAAAVARNTLSLM